MTDEPQTQEPARETFEIKGLKGIKFSVSSDPVKAKLEKAILEYLFTCSKEEFRRFIIQVIERDRERERAMTPIQKEELNYFQ
jgi:hypothetical protein